MIFWALVFFGISILAAIFGMNGVAGLTMDIAQFLIVTFLIIAGVFLALGIWGANKAKNILK